MKHLIENAARSAPQEHNCIGIKVDWRSDAFEVITAKQGDASEDDAAIPELFHRMTFADRIDMELMVLTSPTVHHRLSEGLALLREKARFIRVLVNEGMIDPTCTQVEAVAAARRDIKIAALVWRSASEFYLPVMATAGARRHDS